MRLFVLSLLATLGLSLTTPPPLTAGTFSSPFTKFGVVDPRISAYVPPFAKRRPNPPCWKKRRPALIAPCRCGDLFQGRPDPPAKPDVEAQFVLDPAIFDPAPKNPMTLVIEDGRVVDTYRGY